MVFIGLQATLSKPDTDGLDINRWKKLPLEVYNIMCFAYSEHMGGNTSVMGSE